MEPEARVQTGAQKKSLAQVRGGPRSGLSWHWNGSYVSGPRNRKSRDARLAHFRDARPRESHSRAEAGGWSGCSAQLPRRTPLRARETLAVVYARLVRVAALCAPVSTAGALSFGRLPSEELPASSAPCELRGCWGRDRARLCAAVLTWKGALSITRIRRLHGRPLCLTAPGSALVRVRRAPLQFVVP